ncbi:TetR/AcrR family transcriptional regulator [Sphaerisporangium sp. B11E5]|uniref:TetR/AcrR family transcriptional regulator n=1 Tax=Sphaerisporangium sp. B11E5 TaxID=3153563 RepID=UPI00325D5852
MGATSRAPDAHDHPPGGSRPARRRLSVDRRREELMAAALELFSKHDAEDVSVDDVASAAGASRALVYHYFGGKQELYVTALRGAAEELEERLRPVGGGSALEEIADGLTRYFDFVEDHAAGFAALLRGGPANRTGEVGEIVESVRRRMLRMITHRMRVEEPGAALRVTLRSWIASVEIAGLDWLENRDMDRATLESLLVDQMTALLGVAARHDHQVNVLLADLLPMRAQ